MDLNPGVARIQDKLFPPTSSQQLSLRELLHPQAKEVKLPGQAIQPFASQQPGQPTPVQTASPFTLYEQHLLTPNNVQPIAPQKSVQPPATTQPIQPTQFSSNYEQQLLAPGSTPQAEYPKQPGPLAILGNAWQQTQDQSKGIRQGQAQTAMAERVPIQGTALEKFGLSVNAVQDARTGATILEISGEPDKKIRRFVPGWWDADRKVWVVRNFWDHQNNKEVPFGNEEGTMTPQDFAEVIAGRMEGNQARSGLAQKAGYLEDRFSSQILPALSLQPEKSDYHGTAETFGEKAIDVAAGIAGRSFTPLPGMGGTTFFGAMSGTVGKEAAMKATPAATAAIMSKFEGASGLATKVAPEIMKRLPELSMAVTERLVSAGVSGGVSSSATLAANRAFLEFINTPLSRNEWKDIPAHMKGAAKGIVQDAAVGFIIGMVFGVTVQSVKEVRLAQNLKSYTEMGHDVIDPETGKKLKTGIFYKFGPVKSIKDLNVKDEIRLADGRAAIVKSINADGTVTVGVAKPVGTPWPAPADGANYTPEEWATYSTYDKKAPVSAFKDLVVKPKELRLESFYAEPLTRANAKARVALLVTHGSDYTEAVQNQLLPYGQAGENVLRVAAGEKPLPYSTTSGGRLDTTAAKTKPYLDNVQRRIDQGTEAPKPGEMKGLGQPVPSDVQRVPFTKDAPGMTVRGTMPQSGTVQGDVRVMHPSEFKPDPATTEKGNSWPELLRHWKAGGANVDAQMKSWLVDNNTGMANRGTAPDALKGMDVGKMTLDQVMKVMAKSPAHKYLVDALSGNVGGTPSVNLPVSTAPAPAPALEPAKPISIPAPPPLESVTAPSSALPELTPSGISTPQPATPVPAVPIPQAATPKASEATTFEEGARVTWTDSKGKTLTGTIDYESEVGKTKGYAVQVDQTTTAGGVPIKRKEFIAASELRPLDAGTEKPVETTQEKQPWQITKAEYVQAEETKSQEEAQMMDYIEEQIEAGVSHSDIAKALNITEDKVTWLYATAKEEDHADVDEYTAEESHLEHVKDALRKGTLTPEEFIKLHGKDYNVELTALYKSKMEAPESSPAESNLWKQNQAALESAETGKPATFEGLRYGDDKNAATTGMYYSIEPNWAKKYSNGKTDPVTEKVMLQNPLVVDGEVSGGAKYNLANKLMADLPVGDTLKTQIAKQLDIADGQEWEQGEVTKLDALIKQAAEKLGYDGIVLKRGTAFPDTDPLNSTEVIVFPKQTDALSPAKQKIKRFNEVKEHLAKSGIEIGGQSSGVKTSGKIALVKDGNVVGYLDIDKDPYVILNRSADAEVADVSELGKEAAKKDTNWIISREDYLKIRDKYRNRDSEKMTREEHIERLDASMANWRREGLDKSMSDDYAKFMAQLQGLKDGKPYKITHDTPEELIRGIGSLIPQVNRNAKGELIPPKGDAELTPEGKKMSDFVESTTKKAIDEAKAATDPAPAKPEKVYSAADITPKNVDKERWELGYRNETGKVYSDLRNVDDPSYQAGVEWAKTARHEKYSQIESFNSELRDITGTDSEKDPVAALFNGIRTHAHHAGELPKGVHQVQGKTDALKVATATGHAIMMVNVDDHRGIPTNDVYAKKYGGNFKYAVELPLRFDYHPSNEVELPPMSLHGTVLQPLNPAKIYIPKDNKWADDVIWATGSKTTPYEDWTIKQTLSGAFKSQEPAKQQPATTQKTTETTSTAKITDFGEKIGGARKDTWATRNMTIEDLDNMTDREADKFVTKDAIWKKPNYEQMVAEGMEPHVAWLIKKAKDALPAKVPPTTDVQKNRENRERYIEFIQTARDAIGAVKTVEDFAELKDKVLVQPGYYDPSKQGRDRWTQKGKENQFIVDRFIKAIQPDRWDVAKAKRDVEKNGFPGKIEQWRKDISIVEFKDGDKWAITRKSWGNSNQILASGFESRDEAERHLETELKPKLTKGGDLAPEPVIPQLANIERTGHNYRAGKDVTGEDLIKAFGFRGGEFGNWNTQAERQASMNFAFDALMDLAAVLGISPRDISLNGELGIAFGARGSGGKHAALAHYEPSKVVINLTKMKGAGSLAHEWLHAMDDYLGRVSGDKTAANPLLTSGITHKSKVDAGVKAAFTSLLDVIRYTEKTDEDIVADAQKLVTRAEKAIDGFLKRTLTDLEKETKAYVYDRKQGKRVEETIRAATAKEMEKVNALVAKIKVGTSHEVSLKAMEELSELNKAIKGRVINKETRDGVASWIGILVSAKTRPDRVKAGDVKVKKDSNYMEAAKAIDKATGRKKIYWALPEEMMARAFAAYVEDNLAGKSQYLVHSSRNGGYGDLKPYPEGEERTRINGAFDGLFAAMRKAGYFTAGEGQKAPAPKADPAPVPVKKEEAPEKVTIVDAGNRMTTNPSDLAADYKARGMDKFRAWDQFIIDKGLKPGMDAKEFYSIFASVSARPLTSTQEIDFKATHTLTEINGSSKRVMVTEESDTVVSFVTDYGSTGSTPRKFIKSLEPIGATVKKPMVAEKPAEKKETPAEKPQTENTTGFPGQELKNAERLIELDALPARLTKYAENVIPYFRAKDLEMAVKDKTGRKVSFKWENQTTKKPMTQDGYLVAPGLVVAKIENVWTVSHHRSGVGIPAGFEKLTNQKDATIWALRLSDIADWRQPLDKVKADKELKGKIDQAAEEHQQKNPIPGLDAPYGYHLAQAVYEAELQHGVFKAQGFPGKQPPKDASGFFSGNSRMVINKPGKPLAISDSFFLDLDVSKDAIDKAKAKLTVNEPMESDVERIVPTDTTSFNHELTLKDALVEGKGDTKHYYWKLPHGRTFMVNSRYFDYFAAKGLKMFIDVEKKTSPILAMKNVQHDIHSRMYGDIKGLFLPIKAKDGEYDGLEEQLQALPKKPEPTSFTPEDDSSAIRKMQEELSAEIDEVLGDVGLPAGMSIRRVGALRSQKEKDQLFTSADPEVEERIKAAHGLPEETFWQKMRHVSTALHNKATRSFEHLPNDPKYAQLRFVLRNLMKQKDIAGDETLRFQQWIVIEFMNDPQRFALFERKVLLNDLAEEMAEGHDLPFGYTPEILKNDVATINEMLEDYPAVVRAIQKREKTWKAIKADYVKAQEAIGHKVDEKFTRERYFRHQVIEYAHIRGMQGSGKKLRTPTGRGFLKQREGSRLDINTHYLEAEYEVMAQMIYDIELAKVIKMVKETYDKVPALKQRAKDLNHALIMKHFDAMAREANKEIDDAEKWVTGEDMYRRTLNKKQAIGFGRLSRMAEDGALPGNDIRRWSQAIDDLAMQAESDHVMPYLSWLLQEHNETDAAKNAALIFKGIREKNQYIEDVLGDKFATWRDLVPEDHMVWQPKEGNYFYFADSIPAKVAEKLYAEALGEVDITKDDVRKVLAMGQRLPEFVLPQEVTLTLDNLVKDRPLDPVREFAKSLMGKWKQYQLISPTRLVKYNVRNISGDADAVFIGNPSAFLKVPQAVRELQRVFYGDASMTPAMRDWFKRGGMQSTLQVQEMGDINRLKMFQDMLEARGTIKELPVKAIQKYWSAARLSTDFREAILRYAAYLDYLEQMKNNNGVPKNFGASNREEVMALDDIQDRAFMLSNDLLGAYDSISVLGQELREYLMPFWSWKEVNFKRYVQFFKNAAYDGDLAQAAGRTVWTVAKRSPFIAGRIGMFLLKALALWAMLQAWNNTRFPDEEKALPEYVRNNPHIILGRDSKGNVLFYDRLGAFGDFLEWFSADSPLYIAKEYLNGRMSLSDVAKNTAISPPNVLFQSVGPQYKTILELISGQTYFPDLTQPSQIRDKGQYLARHFGMGDVYDSLKGLPRRPNALSRLATGVQVPGEGSYYNTIDQKYRFMDEIGKGSNFVSGGTERSKALYYVRMAARYGDKEAFTKHLIEYAATGGTYDGLETSFRNMNPLHGLNAEEKKYFVEQWLDEEGRDQMHEAINFYENVILHQAGTFLKEATTSEK